MITTMTITRSSLTAVLDDAADFVKEADGGDPTQPAGWKSDEAMMTWLNLLSARAYCGELIRELSQCACEQRECVALLRLHYPRSASTYDEAVKRTREMLARSDFVRVVAPPLANDGSAAR
jgi:hypothetical protein